jgi:hypothetical protein
MVLLRIVNDREFSKPLMRGADKYVKNFQESNNLGASMISGKQSIKPNPQNRKDETKKKISMAGMVADS